ncbi:MAG: 23S rRNA (uracil(1939)-C(5))-methyltransferase RlmD [Eubacterium sp.]|nr:23S rRNA (uracil(1939)-C(5))-methyltransferase RlmD [Eubacterium sp.]
MSRDHKENYNRKTNRSKNNLCPYHRRCGGCQYINMPYDQQLAEKQKYVDKLLSGFGRVEPIIGMKDPFHYRNKVHGVVGMDRQGNGYTGIYEADSHRLVRVDYCMIENQKADQIMQSVAGLMKSFKMKAYNEDTGYGFLRHILIRTGHHTGEILLVLVTASPIFPSRNNFVKALRKLHPEITSIVVNVNDRDTSMILADRQQVLYGKGYIEDILCGKRFRISPKSFYQVNPVQTEILYGKAIEYAGLTGRETVLDAYSGIGTIGMVASDHAGHVIGVELNGEAVKDAIAGARINKIHNIQFVRADAGEYMARLASGIRHSADVSRKKVSKQSLTEQAIVRPDVLFMDPPRSGSSREFLSCLLKLKPEKVVYISCNPETLQRDLKYLTGNGYRVKKMQPVDMFPMTEKCECVVLLTTK